VTVGFILNGEDVRITCNSETRLINILRDDFHLKASKAGCNTGFCGACTVLLDNDIVKACLVPAFKIRGREIITAEGFLLADDYEDIAEALVQARVENCGFCYSATVLTIEALLTKFRRPSNEEILSALNGIRCRCSDHEAIVRSVKMAVELRRQRIYGRTR